MIILFVGVAVLSSVFYFLGGFPPAFLKQGFFFVSQPFVFLRSGAENFLERNLTVLENKKQLEEENNFLKQRIREYELKEEFSVFFEEENKALKKLLLFEGERELMISSILSRPGYGIYNSLIVDLGSDRGAVNGMPVVALGDVFLGHIFETAPKMSKIKMVSFPGMETNVFVGNKISAIAVGLGGENLEIVLPGDVIINEGDVITTLDTAPLFLGSVASIEKDPADPFQRILFRLPVNIQELRYVFLVKNGK